MYIYQSKQDYLAKKKKRSWVSYVILCLKVGRAVNTKIIHCDCNMEKPVSYNYIIISSLLIKTAKRTS